MTTPAKTETPLTDAEELRLAKLGATELATWTPFARQLEREVTQWREVAGRLAEAFRRAGFKTDDHWTRYDWENCDNAIKAYDALAKLSEKQ